MTAAQPRAERRAQRLLRCYPRAWRDRYGDEFGALLVDDLMEQPRSLRRDIDVVRAGLGARLAACGLTRGTAGDRSSARAAAAVAAACFAGCALSIWTQLADGWLTGRPETRALAASSAVSLVALSGWLLGLAALTTGFGLRMVVAVVRTCRSGAGRPLLRPLLALGFAGGVLAAGLWAVAPHAPGGQSAHHDGAFAHAAGIGWAATECISTFWLHPHRLLALPAGQLAWMLICPAALVAAGSSLARIARLTGRPARQQARRPPALAALLLPGLAGAAVWVICSQHATNPTFRAGTLDVFLIATMTAACWAVRRSLSGDGPGDPGMTPT